MVARAFFSIGFLHTQLEEYDQAVSAYDQSIELLPTFADAYTNRGAVKSLLGNPEGAVADHSEAIRLNPNFVEAYINRGSAKRALSQHEEAISDFDEAIRLDAASAVTWTLRGESKGHLVGMRKQLVTIMRQSDSMRLMLMRISIVDLRNVRWVIWMDGRRIWTRLWI